MTLPAKATSALAGLSGDLQHLLVTRRLPKARVTSPRSASPAGSTAGRRSSVTDRDLQEKGSADSPAAAHRQGKQGLDPHPRAIGVTAGAKPTLFLPGLRAGRALPSSDTGFSEGTAFAGSGSAPGPFMAAR